MNKQQSIISTLLSILPSICLAAEAPSAITSMLQVIFGLLVVLAVMAGLAWLLKHFNTQQGNNNAVAKIVGGVSVGSRERLIVVEVADRWLVVGVAPGQITNIANLDKSNTQVVPSSATEEAKPALDTFSKWLGDALNNKK